VNDFDKRLNRLEELVLALLPNKSKFKVGDLVYYEGCCWDYKKGIVKEIKLDKNNLKWSYYVECVYEHLAWHKGIPNQKLLNYNWHYNDEYLFFSLNELKEFYYKRIEKNLL